MVAWLFLCKRMLRFNMCSVLILDTHKYGTLQRATNPGQGWRARWPTVPSPLQMQMDHHWQQCGLCNLATQSRTALSESKNCFFKKRLFTETQVHSEQQLSAAGMPTSFLHWKVQSLGKQCPQSKAVATTTPYETPLFT